MPDLDTIQKDLEQQRRDLYEQRAEIDKNISIVESALGGLTGKLPPPPRPRKDDLRDHFINVARDRRLSIGDDKLATVREYLRKQPGGQARQADIAVDTGLNDGTVSVAVAVMVEQAEIEPLGKVNRSRVWKLRRGVTSAADGNTR